MKVSSLLQSIELRDDKSLDTFLGDLSVDADCTMLRVKSQHLEFPWDEQAERAIASYLSLPKAYLHRCDPAFRAATVNHWLAFAENADTTVEYTGGDEKNLIALQRPDRPVLPLYTVGEIVTRVFDPEDEVVKLLRDESTFHLDVMTNHQVLVPDAEGIPDRQWEVGDVTKGGVRILATPHQSKPPIVQQYLHRLVCTNGMTQERASGTIKLRGKTLPEVLEELETTAETVLGGLDERLREFAAMAERRIPGNPATFAFRIAQENGIGARATERIMARAGALPTDGRTSLYDVANILTEVAQSGGMPYKSTTHLQEVAGSLSADQEAVLNRCTSCEKPLDA